MTEINNSFSKYLYDRSAANQGLSDDFLKASQNQEAKFSDIFGEYLQDDLNVKNNFSSGLFNL